MFTHCPNCDTHFEISQEYLDIANGKVRCGQCDHIFNALDNLYEKQSTTVDDIQSSDGDSKNENDSTLDTPTTDISDDQTNPDPQVDNTSTSIPSNDIKEKMERISASLSAATAELKNARQSTSFQESSSTFTEEKTSLDSEPPINTAESTETNSSTDVVEPLEVDDSLEIAEAIKDDEPLNIEEAVEEQESTDIIDDDELDIVRFEESEFEEPAEISSTLDFNDHNVDENDVDILNSLIEGSEFSSANNELLDELDDINQTLSDSSHSLDDELDNIESTLSDSSDSLDDELDNIENTLSDNSDSLDDEFSNLGNDFDDLDSDDELLAELEQLESDFLNNDQASQSPDDSLASVEDSLTSVDDSLTSADDLLFENIDDTSDDSLLSSDADKHQSITDDALVDELGALNKESEEPAKEAVQEEVVPSFLTQSDSSSTNPTAMFGWLAGTLISLLLLATQYLHFNSTQFVQNPTIRPLLEILCPITNCSLPLIKTPKKIVTVSHDVRSHSKINNALEIQLIFKNKASYTQGYPLVEITFSNPLGQVTARRQFHPEEYLSGEIQYQLGLKSNQSQEIDLKIVDPDPSSLLSFQFNYL